MIKYTEITDKIKKFYNSLFNRRAPEVILSNPYVPIPSDEMQKIISDAKSSKWVGYINNPSFALDKDPDIRSKMMRDADIAAAWSLSVFRTIGLDYSISNDDVASELGRFINFEDCLRWLCDSDFNGLQLIGINFDEYRFEHIEPELVTKAKDTDGIWRWATINDDHKAIPVDPNCYIISVVDPRQGSFGYGVGLRDALYLPWYIYAQIFSNMITSIEHLGQPFIKEGIDIPGLTSLNAADVSTAISLELTRLSEMRNSGILVHSKQNEIEIITPTPVDAVTVDLLHRLSLQKIKIIQGGTLNTGGEQSGALGIGKAADVSDEQTDYIIKFRRKRIANDINKQLLPLIWRKIGFKGEQPLFKWSDKVDVKNPDIIKTYLEVFKFMQTLSSELSRVNRQEFFSKLGLTDPMTDKDQNMIDLKTQVLPSSPDQLGTKDGGTNVI